MPTGAGFPVTTVVHSIVTIEERNLNQDIPPVPGKHTVTNVNTSAIAKSNHTGDEEMIFRKKTVKKEARELRKIIMKPTLACTANCKTCAYRRELHRELSAAKTLSLDDWKKILSDAHELGNKRLSISGGEPTLYRDLTELIKTGKGFGWHVGINTNGSLITREYAKRLMDAGLDQVRISLYSHIPEVHDEMRNRKGLWEKAVNAIRIFSDLRQQYPYFRINTQTIICKDNYKELTELIKLHYESGSVDMNLSYLEGDFEKQFLLSRNELEEFKERVIPEAIRFCKEHRFPVDTGKNLKKLYNEKAADMDDYAGGIYRPPEKNHPFCNIPRRQAEILANGDIHPCNIVEYSHTPVVGNLFENTLGEIWRGEKREHFREHFFRGTPVDYCTLCPMYLYTEIPLRKR